MTCPRRSRRSAAGRSWRRASTGSRAVRCVDAIVVVAPPQWEEPAILLAEEIGAGKVTSCVPGGSTRAGSVSSASQRWPDEAEVILVHDAARPLRPRGGDRARARAARPRDGTASVPGTPGRRHRQAGADGRSPRPSIALVSTRSRRPRRSTRQAFRRALAGPVEDATDCAAFVEAAGGRVKVVEGDPRLVKVTTSADLARRRAAARRAQAS